MGGGGEIYRQKKYRNHTDEESVYRQFLDWSYKYNPLGVLTNEAVERQQAFIRSEARRLLAEGIRNHQPKFYIDHRLSNWGASHLQNNTEASIAPLVDIDLTRLMFSSAEMGEDIHFEIMRRAEERLLHIPFLNDRWTGSTGERARSSGLDVEPLEVPVERNFPWQFEWYGRRRDALIDFLLDRSALFRGQVCPDRLRALRASPVEPFNSASVKMLFGLVGAAILMEGGYGGKRDYYEVEGVAGLHGSRAREIELFSSLPNERPYEGTETYHDLRAALLDGRRPRRVIPRGVRSLLRWRGGRPGKTPRDCA
jgi:hypothetical protein